MKLRELAKDYELKPEPLLEDIPDALGIELPDGLDTDLGTKDVNRILVCAGWEREDGGEHEPVVAGEIEEKHKRRLAAKKAAETRRRKQEEEKAKKAEEERLRQEEEHRKHLEALKLREEEERLREERDRAEAEKQAEIEDLKTQALADVGAQLAALQEEGIEAAEGSEAAEAVKNAVDDGATAFDEADAAAQQEAEEPSAEDQEKTQQETIRRNLQQRQSETERRRKGGRKPEKPEKPAAKEPAKPAAPAAADEGSGSGAFSALDRLTAAARQLHEERATGKSASDIAGEAAAEAAETAASEAAEAEAAAAAEAGEGAEETEEERKRTARLGSKLASLAKATAEKANHATRDKGLKELRDIAPSSKPGAAGVGSGEAVTDDERRLAIQRNIQKNLDMAKRAKEAKQAERGRRGFRTIDRRGMPGAGRGPGGPGRGPGGGPPGPPGPPGMPGRGPRRSSRSRRAEKSDSEGRQKGRRRPLSTEEQDLSGKKEFTVTMPCTVRDFSEASGLKVSVIIAKLFMAGVGANINSSLDRDTIELLAQEFEKDVTIGEEASIEDELEQLHTEEDDPEDLAPRPPVVTILGHVDHGKTSLLDAIRKTQLTAGEAGGITQHVGAYTVETPNGMEVTFIDTPGHEAFSAMRARGAQVTDVAVIVVAADDGVMPQTVEAINHAKAAGVSIVVAMNKIDKDNADPDKVLRQLAEQGLQAEEWGGDVGVLRVSATTGEGLDELLDRLALESEIMELQANHFAKASGAVLEANLHEGRGVTATVLVQRGSLAVGDVVIAGAGYGRVRALIDWKADEVRVAGPSHAVEIIGLNDVPIAGDRFQCVADLKTAANIAEERAHKLRERELHAKSSTTTLATLFKDIEAAKVKEIKLIVKADASGTLEVLKKSLHDLSTDEVRVNLIHAGIGAVSNSDVTLAEASDAIIIGFHVIADGKARQEADAKGVDIKSYTIIYELIDNVRAAMSGLLDPDTLEKVIGHAEIRATFKSSKWGTIAGLFVTDGIVQRDCYMRLTRDGVITHEGRVRTLRRFQEDVKEVRDGYECGLTIEKYDDVQQGDILEFYVKESVARVL